MLIFTRRLGLPGTRDAAGAAGSKIDAGSGSGSGLGSDAGVEAGAGAAASAPDVSGGAEAGTLRLTYDWRQKSRCRVRVAEAAAPADARGARLAAGDEVGLDLPRGAVLRDGERIATDDGIVLRVRAAVEQLLQVRAPDALALARIAYHLGNRHVPVQVGADARAGWLRLQLDHVLENMVAGLGGTLEVVSASFDPEAGAYSHGHASHGHAMPDALGAPASALPDRRHAPRIHDFTDGSP